MTEAKRPRLLNPRSRIFTVEGVIAAGKTELAKSLAAGLEARGLDVCLVLEPVDQWKSAGVLQAFYKDPARYAYSFQTYVFATRVIAIHTAMAAKPHADVYIFERSPVTDPVFMSLQQVEPLEKIMYESWCSAWKAMNSVDYSQATAIYLCTSPETCTARLTSRAREGEIAATTEPADAELSPATGGVSVEYQALLRRAHDAFYLRKNMEEFPNLPANPITNVIVVRPEIADSDFRHGSPTSGKSIDLIIKKMGYA